MEQANQTVTQLAGLAKQLGNDLNPDWSKLGISEDDVYMHMANNVFEQFDNIENDEEAVVVSLATITKLLVENLILRSMVQKTD